MKTHVTKVERVGNPAQGQHAASVSTKWVSTLWAIAFTLTLGAVMLAIAITSAPHQ